MTRRIAAFLALLAPSLASAATITVDAAGGADYTSIQDAIDAASSGDAITVAAGTYEEAISFDGKLVQITGAGAEDTIIDAGGMSTFAVAFTSGETSSAALEGFTIRNTGKQGMRIKDASPMLSDLIFEELGAEGTQGGAVRTTGGSPTFTSCFFDGNTATSGGHVYVGSGSPTFDGTTLEGGYAEYGGGIYVASGTLTLTNSVVDGNKAAYSGAGLFVGSGAALVMMDSDVTDSRNEDGHGSGLYAEGAEISVTGGTFSGNYASQWTDGYYGGGAYLTDATIADFTDVIFSENTAYYGGALSLNNSSDATLQTCTLRANYAYYGGAANLYSSNLSDTGSEWDANTSYYYGAAIYAYYLFDLSFNFSTFTENLATYGYGGAVYGYYYGDVSIADSTFSGNYAYYGGGGLYAYYLYGGVDISDSSFSDNDGKYGYGGAVYSYVYTDTTISDSSFEGNYAYYQGGAVWAGYYGFLVVSDSVFDGNTAEYQSGGALYYDAVSANLSNVTVEGSSFTDNDARYEGGAVYVKNAANVKFNENEVIGNVLRNDSFGGGVYAALNSRVRARNNRFLRNEAVFGAGLYLTDAYGSDGSATLTNNVLAENQASRLGGALCALDIPMLEVANNTIVGNQASEAGGGIYLYASTTDLRNNILGWTVSGEALYAFDDETAASTTLAYNDLYENAVADLGGGLEGATPDETNLAIDPMLAGWSLDPDATQDAFQLARDSALIDAGDPELVDPDGTRSDIGAYGGPNLVVYDLDDDGYDSSQDCDDEDAAVYPYAEETWYDGINQDCLSGSDYDMDGDDVDAAPWGDDCDDADATVTSGCEDGTLDSGDDTGGDDTGPEGREPVDDVQDTGTETKGEGCACSSAAPRSGRLWLAGVAIALLGVRRRRPTG